MSSNVGHPDQAAQIPLRVHLLRGTITLCLLAAAVVYQGYNVVLAFDADDSNHLETTMALIVARELQDGPSTLYGPSSGENPLVLIHAPLYYRLAAGGAWIGKQAGMDPIVSAFASGRLISLVGMLGTILAAAWLARMDGRSLGVGLWAGLLIASAPVFGSFPVTVRPDTLALALQTWGVALAVRAIRDGKGSKPLDLPLAFVALALAACTKQHLVISAGVMIVVLAMCALGRRVRAGRLVVSIACGVLIAGSYALAEESLTNGRMFTAVFTLPSRFRETAGASWDHVLTVYLEVAKASVGLLAMWAAVLIVSPRKLIGTWLDSLLWIVLLTETAAIIPLCLASEGAWVNYAMPSVVYACVLLARAARSGVDRAKSAISARVSGSRESGLALCERPARRDFGHQSGKRPRFDPTGALGPKRGITAAVSPVFSGTSPV